MGKVHCLSKGQFTCLEQVHEICRLNEAVSDLVCPTVTSGERSRLFFSFFSLTNH